MSSVDIPTLPPMSCDVPENILNATRWLVKNKYLLDRAQFADRAIYIEAALLEPGNSRRTMNATAFFGAVFPFAWEEDMKSSRRMGSMVPLDQVIGATCKWHWGSIAEERRGALQCFFMNPARGTPGSAVIEKSDFILIRPLGLVVVINGQNRVDFLRQSGETQMPAVITERDYPSARRIKLYKPRLSISRT